MYIPKRGFENGPEDKIKYFPMRELPDLDQTLIDTMIEVDDNLSDEDLGYFVPMCNGRPWHHYQNERVTQ